MQNEPIKIKVEATPEFKRSIRTLAKRYRHIRSDIQPTIDRLQASEIMGAQISGTDYSVFKVRIKNSDIQKGKSGGYRFIYYLKTSTQITLVTLYSKSDQGDISADRINSILSKFESS
ncbi:MAG: type II toxin-antitoxin system RelE/ParE family toxin [Phormidesmis sp.]